PRRADEVEAPRRSAAMTLAEALPSAAVSLEASATAPAEAEASNTVSHWDVVAGVGGRTSSRYSLLKLKTLTMETAALVGRSVVIAPTKPAEALVTSYRRAPEEGALTEAGVGTKCQFMCWSPVVLVTTVRSKVT